MKENIKKILSRTLITYTFLLVIIFILKIVGLDKFGLDVNNPYILKLNNIIFNYGLENIWYALTMYINVYIVLAITCNDNSKRMKIYTLLMMPICIFIQCIKTNSLIFILLDILYFYILAFIYKKGKMKKENNINYLLITIISSIFQVISLITRNVTIMKAIKNDFIVLTIMSIDYILLIIIFYKLYFLKGGNSIWEVVLGYGLHLMMALKSLPKKLQVKLKNKKKLNKQEKVYNLIFYPFVIVYNLFSMAVIFLIAYLCNSVIECLFITLCFWINKFSFGKPFHAKDTKTCFVISSISYIIINKLATETIGISYLWQVILGVMFSFITSRFVKKTIGKLYKGITEEEFNNRILKVTDKGSLQYKICYMYYVEKISELNIAHKVGYSIDNIKKIKSKINKQIEGLQ